MRYLQLISFGVDPSEILAVTFTRKAAGEIFDKIITRVLAIIQENSCCAIANRKKFIPILQKLLCPEKDFRISTIDSFLSSLVKTYAPELGISGEFTMIDADDDRIKKKVLRKWIAESTEKDELRELIKDANNGEQINFEASMCKIIDDIYTFYLGMLFDNGKGKTEWGKKLAFESKLEDFSHDDLLRICDYLNVFGGGRPQTQMDRTTDLTKYIADEKRGNLTQNAVNLLKNFNDYNETGWLFENGCPLNYSKTITFPADAADYYRKAFRFVLKTQLNRCHDKTKAIYTLVKKFDELYNRDVRGKGIVTFDDLKILLRDSGENETFHLRSSEEMNMEERLDSKLNHYLFDEFQDTSNNEWYIFENLVNEVLSADDDRFRSIFCVGDIKQTIYQWRGADPTLFGRVIQSAEFAAENRGYTSLKSLYESYRSSQDVLDAVNDVFETPKLPGFFPDAIERMAYTRHESKKKNFPGYSALIDVSKDKDKDQMDAKARVIADILNKISPFTRSEKLTVGVLMQKNEDCAALAAHLSTLVDMPISIDGNISPQKSMAFSVLKQLITLAEHPGDNTARRFLEMLNIGGIHYSPEELAEKFGWQPSGETDYDKLAKLISLDIFKYGLDGFIQHFLDAFGPQLDQFDFDRIEAARTLAENFTGTPDEYLHAVDTWHKLKDQSVARTIQFMTIHKSKGLEFDVVFLPQMKTSASEIHGKRETAYPEEAENGVRWINYFPSTDICKMVPEMVNHRKLKNRERVFEECCKFYVAMTRAKRAMYIFTGTDKMNAVPENITFEEMMTNVLSEKNSVIEQGDAPYKLLYATGTENWYDLLKNVQEVPQTDKQSHAAPIFIKSKKKRFLASHQHKFHVVPEYRFSAGKAAAAGTVLHDLFEKIDYIDNNFSSVELLDRENISDDEIRELFITATAESSELRSALKKPAEPHILWKERRFLLKGDNGELIPGAFDRVVITLDDAGNMSKAEILDYKSDNVKSEKELTDRHRAQLELYRSCLSRMTGIPQENITIKLAALRMGKIIEIA